MKKVLLASTVLAFSAGVAAAEVKFSGDARVGLQYNSAGAGTTTLEKRFSLNIDGSTTTDGGVTLGARVRIRSDEVGTNTGIVGQLSTFASGARVFASYGGLTVAGGNINGAIDSVPNLYGPSVGLTGNGWTGLVTNVSGFGHTAFDWDAFQSNNAGVEGIEVIYSASGFTVHLSHSSVGLRGGALLTPVIGGYSATVTSVTAGYVSYNFSGYTAAVFVQDAVGDASNINDKIGATIGGKIGDFGVQLGYASNGAGANKIDKFALSGSATFGATTVNAFVASQTAVPGLNGTTYGLGARYNLGGGAAIVGGVASTTTNTTRADLGVTFNF